MNDDPLLDENNTEVDFNEIPSPPGIEQAINKPLIKEHPAGMGDASSSEQQKTQPEQQEKPHVENKKYEVEGVGITVNYETLHPTEESIRLRQVARELKGIEGKPYAPIIPEGKPDDVVLFLPGWSLNAGTKSAREVGQAFADVGDKKVFVVDVKPDKVVDNTLYKEAEAISRFVKESGVKRITISGYSEGGVRAVNLAVILHKQYPDIEVDGVVLMESTGLYDQGSKKGFVGNFAKDTFIDTPINLARELRHADAVPLAKGLRTGTEVLFGIIKEIGRTGRHYPERVRSQIQEMQNTLANLGEIQVPVILVHGTDDLASNPEKVIPGYKDLGRMVEDEKTGEQYRLPMEKDEKTGELYDPREKFLKENLFRGSPHVRMVTGEKLSNHSIPVLRARQIATDSLYLLERFKREQAPIQPQPTVPTNSAV